MYRIIKGTSILREQNKRKVLSLIRHLGETSRQDLVNKMNVSKNTISLIVDDFIQENILVEIGVKEANKKGRPKIIIKINESHLKAIGLYVSKRRIEYSVTNYYGKIIENKSFNHDCTNANSTINKIIKIARALLQRFDHVIGIGVGIPGIINSNQRLVDQSIHLGWDNTSLAALDELSLPITVQNSVNMAAIEAKNYEKHSENSSLFYLRIGEGVGGAYIINDSLVNGNSWTAGEIGHISVDSNGARCVCGQSGCLEILVNYKALMGDLDSIGIHQPLIKNGNLFFDNEHYNSNEVKHLMLKNGIYIGKALVQVIHLMNPHRIVIDTPYNLFFDFKQACVSYLKENALDIPLKHTDIVFQDKRYSSVSMGAALSTIINYEIIE